MRRQFFILEGTTPSTRWEDYTDDLHADVIDLQVRGLPHQRGTTIIASIQCDKVFPDWSTGWTPACLTHAATTNGGCRATCLLNDKNNQNYKTLLKLREDI